MSGMIDAFRSHDMDLPVELSVQQTRERAPALKGAVAGSVFRDGDGHCNPRKATTFLPARPKRPARSSVSE